ncbi:MAG: putative rane protein [Phycisphaerales bacterium]|nr:putative rane protein [Phycisphaerales bacterium]
MSEAKTEKTTNAAIPPPEDQSQRWMKYGANVVLATVIVILLAVFVIWLAQAQDLHLFGHRFSLRARPDLTSNASNSLKPQTEAVVKDLPGKVTLVSLYPKLKEAERGQKEDTYDRVLNILEQYRSRNPDKVEVQAIDPIAEPAKLDAWIGQLKRDYGQNVSAYEELLRGFPKTLEQIRAVASGEEKEMSKLTKAINEETLSKLPQDQQEKLVTTINGAFATVRTFPAILDAINENIKTELDKKIPDYAAGRDMIVSFLSQFSSRNRLVSERLGQLRDDKATPPAIAEFAKNSIPGFDEMKRIAEETTAKAKALGKLKLDEVRRKLIPADDTEAPPPAIVVMGKEDIRVIDFDSVWKSGDSTGLTGLASEKPKLRFAGEQQITSAMLALSQAQKKKVAFIRDGGPPLCDPRTGPGVLSDIADRLRAYNFEVLEKDISGQYAQQAMRGGMPPTPEPPDDELKDAVWVVLAGSGDMQTGAPPSPQMAQKLKHHLEPDDKGKDLTVDAKDATLVRSAARKFTPDDRGDTLEIAGTGAWKAGKYKVTDVREDAAVLDNAPAPAGATGGQWEAVPGAALALMTLRGDDLASVMREFGVEVNTNAVAVHEPIESSAGPGDDFIENARHLPPIFVINQYGDHPITTPLNSLDGVILPMLPVKKLNTPGANVTLILPVPQQPSSWGETDLDFPPFSQRGKKPTFDRDKDIEGPLWAGAVVEKKGAGKLVVIGGRDWSFNYLLRIPDQKLQKQRLEVARFPGNGELFTNSIFWLANQENMIALSPSAMDTPRIAAMSPGALNVWRIGVFLIGLPVAALLCGLFVYQSRRD